MMVVLCGERMCYNTPNQHTLVKKCKNRSGRIKTKTVKKYKKKEKKKSLTQGEREKIHKTEIDEKQFQRKKSERERTAIRSGNIPNTKEKRRRKNSHSHWFVNNLHSSILDDLNSQSELENSNMKIEEKKNNKKYKRARSNKKTKQERRMRKVKRECSTNKQTFQEIVFVLCFVQ